MRDVIFGQPLKTQKYNLFNLHKRLQIDLEFLPLMLLRQLLLVLLVVLKGIYKFCKDSFGRRNGLSHSVVESKSNPKIILRF